MPFYSALSTYFDVDLSLGVEPEYPNGTFCATLVTHHLTSVCMGLEDVTHLRGGECNEVISYLLITEL